MSSKSRLTLQQKTEIIEERNDKTISMASLATKYNVSRVTVYNALKKKDDIIRFAEQKNLKKLKKVCGSPYKGLESQLLVWFKQKRSENIIVTRKSFKNQASVIAKQMHLTAFKCSDGWFGKAKKRLNLRSLAVTGQILDCVEDEVIINWLENLKNYILQNHLSPCQIYNSDETGLFYKIRPKKTMVLPSEKRAPGRKIDKQRVTAQVCCNATGDNKIRLMVIGRSRKPRCFAGFDVNDYVYYKSNKTAWMTRELFESWFREEYVPSVRSYSNKMGIDSKALLIIDNAPCHLELVSDDGKIRCMFLPPNSTPILQPMDIGINKPLKDRYNSSLTKKITNDGSIDSDLKNLTLDKVIKMITKAWKKISISTVINAFGVLFGGIQNILNNLPDPPDHFDGFDDLPLRIPPAMEMDCEDVEAGGKLFYFFN